MELAIIIGLMAIAIIALLVSIGLITKTHDEEDRRKVKVKLDPDRREGDERRTGDERREDK